MKKFLCLFLIMFTITFYGQVGVNISQPKATLDITSRGTGSSVDGILIPRVSRSRAQQMSNVENSTLIYINSLDGSQTGNASDVNALGFYYFNASKWVKLNGTKAENGLSESNNIIKLGGNLNSNTTITTNGNNLAFNVSNDQLYINGLNEGEADEAIGNGGILMVDNSGRLKKTAEIASDLSIPVPAVYVLGTNLDNFLANADTGDNEPIKPFTEVKNGITGLVYTGGPTPTIYFPPGVYQISWVYEVESSVGVPNTCTISSYFVDFPVDAGKPMARIHSTAAHNSGKKMNHGGTITYTAVLNNSNTWEVEMGRGQSGNCVEVPDISLKKNSTQITIFRLGDVDVN